jgi:hypothetical protein
MVETAIGQHDFIKDILARVPEGRMAKIMRQGQRFGQIIVEAKRSCKRPRNLANLDGMGQPGSEVIALMRHEDLSLMGKPAEGRGMDDAIAVPLEIRPRRGRRLCKKTPATF